MSYKKWILLIIGSLLIATQFFLKDTLNVNKNSIIEKEITVKELRDIGNKNSYEKYILFSENFSCKFIVDNSGGSASAWKIEDQIKPYDKLIVGISNNDSNLLTTKEKVPIYSLKKNNSYIFTFEDYLKAHDTKNLRYEILGYIVLIFITYQFLKSDKKNRK